MADGYNGKLLRSSRILVAPLDWGLGHATRCIPIIRELLNNDCEVWLAGEGMQESILRLEFPDLPFLRLQGYRVQYSRTKWGLFWKILLGIPGFINRIWSEHRWLKHMVRIHMFDGVISDNRYGLYHSRIPSIFITHQLTIKIPLGKWSERILQGWNYTYINHFSKCWVPDLASETNLAGDLSHPEIKPKVPIKYIGFLSRLQEEASGVIKDHLLFILSGPEPQRTFLENKIIDEISHYPHTATIVRGLPLSHSIIPSTGMIKFHNHLGTKELTEEIGKADWVISRSGYSTVMDLVKFGKKMILVPTPGQTEQEYLASYLNQRQVAYTVEQKEFALTPVLEKAKEFNYRIFPYKPSNDLQLAVREFITQSRIKKS